MTPSHPSNTAQLHEPLRGDTPDERAWRERLVARDPEALAVFFDAWFDRIFAYVRRAVLDEHLAEDLTQEIFVKLAGGFDRYDPERDLEPWVFAVVGNRIRDHWRSARHRASLRDASLDHDELAERLEDEREFGPEARLETEEARGVVRDAVDALPEGMRRAVELRMSGLPFETVGRALDRNADAVRKRYSRALTLLRESLLETHPELASDAGGC